MVEYTQTIHFQFYSGTTIMQFNHPHTNPVLFSSISDAQLYHLTCQLLSPIHLSAFYSFLYNEYPDANGLMIKTPTGHILYTNEQIYPLIGKPLLQKVKSLLP